MIEDDIAALTDDELIGLLVEDLGETGGSYLRALGRAVQEPDTDRLTRYRTLWSISQATLLWLDSQASAVLRASGGADVH